MRFPKLQEVSRYREMTTVFGGYNHQISCEEGQFFDMKNITSQYFPVLSPRQNRGILKTLTNPQGIVDKEDVWYIDNNVLYNNGDFRLDKEVPASMKLPLEGDVRRTLVKMGAYIIIMPDKLWVKVKEDSSIPEWGYMENTFEVSGVNRIDFAICEANGKVIDYKEAGYYSKHTDELKDGVYEMTTNASGKPSLKVYSAATGIWMSVTSTYVQITREGIGKGFKKEDGVKITKNNVGEALNNIFVNDEGDYNHRSVNTYIVDRTDNSIVIPGIYNGSPFYDDMELKVERKVPDMAFITECNNRLWGCSKDGHEIYCCKLGDMTNWNCFRGISTDSWAATVGSDGVFTGAITYLGYPMFFKEDGLIKISISTTGAHQIKETKCRGVQKGSEKSLSILNETLYYKSTNDICGYNGSLPFTISDSLGDVRYYDAVAGSVGDRYYISMRDSANKYSLFVYDSKNGIWCKEDGTKTLDFCRHLDDLYYIDARDNTIKTVRGTLHFVEGEKITDANPVTEDKFEWYVESGAIGYSSPDNKYVGRINLRLTLEFGSNVDLYLQYDSSGEWIHILNMSGKGTRTYTVPIIPRRCDHFKYKIKGKGGCKIHSITKTLEEGSDS